MRNAVLRAAATALVAVSSLGVYARLHSVAPLVASADADSTIVTDRHGVVLFESESPLGRAYAMQPGAVPPLLRAATIAAEDRRFALHFGIDPFAIARASLRTIRGEPQGGSTITQQTAKLLLQTRAGELRKRSLSNKFEETMLAFRLEAQRSKDEILALYLSLAPYGNRVTGAARAADFYFGAPPKELTAAQSALLASLPHRPSKYDPLRTDKARARARSILGTMRDLRSIDEAAYRIAIQEKPSIRDPRRGSSAHHFVQLVLAGGQSGRRIRTSIDARLQSDVAGILESQRRTLERHGARNVAVAVLHNRTGEWLAWEGSGDYFDAAGGAIDGVRALRQPGSTLKPFTYALAFENGFTPASVLPDVPLSFPTAVEGIVYTPRNYDSRSYGPVRARVALAASLNVPATWLLDRSGTGALLHKLRAAGLTTLDRSADHYGLGLTLGNAEVRLDELVNAYATFARGGIAIEPSKFPGRSARTQRRIFDPRAAFWVTDILADDSARSLTFGEGSVLELDFPVAVKTGTSQAYRDNWTVGYTSEVTVGVWVGNFDRRELRTSSGVTGAAPIFRAVMEAANERYPSTRNLLSPTPDLVEVRICSLSGERATSRCPSEISEFLSSLTQASSCSWHAGGAIVWPARYAAWARNEGLVNDDSRVDRFAKNELVITSPPDGATYMLDPTLRMDYQKLKLSARSAGLVRWRIDGRPLAHARASTAVYWKPELGRHTIEAESNGRRTTATIDIR
jgi:penicillin-binding protein 1C